MPIIGRLCCQFSGLLRTSPILPVFQSDHHLAWNVCSRFYSRKSNAMKREKKAAERALAKQNKVSRFTRTSKIIRPYPTDGNADKEPSTDNVWFQHMHPLKQLTFEEGISYHRESVHETVYNDPGAYVNIVAVLNLKTRKQNVMLEKLKGSWMPPHLYPSGVGMRILAICKEKEDIEDALEAGAFTVGGLDVIKKITEGNIQVEEYDLIVAHTDILPNLAPIRGLMKTKMPRANQGTLGRDMADMIIKAKESRPYNLVCDNTNNTIGWVDDAIGKLSMPTEHLRENLREFLSGLLKNQPRVEGVPFVEQLFLRCPATDENFLLSRPSLLREETKDLPGGKKETRQEYVGAGGQDEEELDEEAVQQ